ncbi:STAS domain-containing protein [Pseudonocardia sp. CA-142604]|uniref:STAS domain-containing protein n=1 Tax=Pseudonocardia sp. CA-142604 TaxID=3240024 RepID=UPI003D8B8975
MRGATKLDVRLHVPIPDVVVVRVSGSVDEATSLELARRVGQQLGRAPHVVIDLRDVGSLCERSLRLLSALHRRAVATSTQLHVSADRVDVLCSLRRSGLDKLVPVRPAAELVVAGLAVMPGADRVRA